MLKFFYLLYIGLFLAIASSSSAGQVYVYKLEGENLWITGAADKKLRVMELVPDKTRVVIGEQTSAFLTCPDCEIIKLTAKESPYLVKMESFRKKNSTSKIVLDNFFAAVKAFVYPDAKTGELKAMSVRGDGQPSCEKMSFSPIPGDDEDIMAWGKTIPFQWGRDKGNFTFEIRNALDGNSIFRADTKNAFLNLDSSILTPGTIYSWKVVDNQMPLCESAFTYLSVAETREIEELLEQVVSILPGDADEEIKTRLQVGCLISQELRFDAFRLLTGK